MAQLRQEFMRCFKEQIMALLSMLSKEMWTIAHYGLTTIVAAAREPYWEESAQVEARSWEAASQLRTIELMISR